MLCDYCNGCFGRLIFFYGVLFMIDRKVLSLCGMFFGCSVCLMSVCLFCLMFFLYVLSRLCVLLMVLGMEVLWCGGSW